MHIRYLMLDNGIEFEDELITWKMWGDLKPKTVCIYKAETPNKLNNPVYITIMIDVNLNFNL